MTSSKNIFWAFILNLSFAIIEFWGGNYTKSVAIITDSLHDLADALSIGLSFFLEKKSQKEPDGQYTFGYLRYSVIGSLFTTVILITGSIFAVIAAIKRIINPVEINYQGMFILAILGVIINFGAAYFTHHGSSLNEKSVNLHMLEDVLGWVVVLIGSIIMHFTKIVYIDSILSIIVAIYILIHACGNFKVILTLFLEKTPDNIVLADVKKDLLTIKEVKDIHHMHIWSIDGVSNAATLHVVCQKEAVKIKELIRQKLKKYGILHVTIEVESLKEVCLEKECHNLKNNKEEK